MSALAAAATSGGDPASVKDQWRPCAEWLFRCLSAAPDILLLAQAVLGDPQATVVDMLGLLKDGILLCHILPALSCNEISLGDLEGFKLMTLNSPFVFKKNILAFLGQCEAYFGLKRSDLFKAEDLLEQENIIGIIDSLSTLSRCPKARQSGIAGFEVLRCSPEAESDYYSFVADSQPEPPAPVASSVDEVANASCHSCEMPQASESQAELAKPEEKVYECIINLRKQPPSQKQPQQQLATSKSCGGLTPRDLCIQEIVDTERNYVDTLKLLVDDVMRPMRGKQSAWSPEEVDEIFRYLPELLQLHQKMLQELQIAVMLRAERAKPLPQVFASFKDRMLVYGQYCGHLARAQKLVDNACKCDKRKSEELQQHLSNCRAMFKLSEYLTVPVQRVLKYHLMLRSLISLEQKLQSPDLPQLQQAHDAMCEVADYVNEVKRDLEMIALIDQIQNTIDDLELPSALRLINYGRLQLDEELKVVNDPQRPLGGSKLRYCFLWNRICMLVKSRGPGKEGYVFKNVFAIRTDLLVREVDCPPAGGKRGQPGPLATQQQQQQQQSQQQQSLNNSKWIWMFSVSDPQATGAQPSPGERVSYLFVAKTRESRRRWLDAFQRAKDVLAPPNFNQFGHYFEPATFDAPTYCSVCQRLIHGCFFQGYRCRKTGLQVHRACIPAKPARSTSEVFSPGRVTPAALSHTRYSDITDLAILKEQPPPPLPLRIPLLVSEETAPAPLPSSGPENDGGDQAPAAQESPQTLSRQPSRAASIEGGGCGDPQHPLSGYDWFVGPMSREEARDALLGQPAGTFLVRLSKSSSVDYAISLRYRETIKHMRIERSAGAGGAPCYYLGEIRAFASIPALVAHYSAGSLCECFNDLDTTLARPIRAAGGSAGVSQVSSRQHRSGSIGTSTPRRSSVIGYAMAVRDYAWPGHLTLCAGETVTLLASESPQQPQQLCLGRRANGAVGHFPPDAVLLVQSPFVPPEA